MPDIHPIIPVILSGGSGTRLWPLSRSLYPKQFHALAGSETMIQQTGLRVKGKEFAPPILVCNHEHRFIAAEQMREAGVSPQAIIVEPLARNTAPAVAASANFVAARDANAVMLVLPADHVVTDEPAFLEAVAKGAEAARDGAIVTLGIRASAPETGYGYIEAGHEIAPGIHRVARFVEKPEPETARQFVGSGRFSWNSGIFLFTAKVLLQEMAQFEPDVVSACSLALVAAREDLDFIRLEEEAFKACKSISLDYAVMEKTGRAAVVPVEMGWSDVGSWDSLWALGPHDGNGNVLSGQVIAEGVRDSYLRSDDILLAASGIEGLTIIASRDAVLVLPREKAQDVKAIVDEIRARGLKAHLSHSRVLRPWGSYETLNEGTRFQVKRIVVKPGARLSLQAHAKRAEHWIIVSGTGRITRGEEVFALNENESTFIPLGTKHRLENPGSEPLILIEVQSGSYLGEDDIERFDDDYGRKE